MALYEPVSRTVPQYSKDGDELASGYYLKGYIEGTTTPLSMATDDTGGTTLAKCKLNTAGYPLSNDSDDTSVFIPHFNADFKLALYLNAADADADTTGNAVWVVDAIPIAGSAAKMTYSQGATNSVARTTEHRLQDSVNIEDFYDTTSAPTSFAIAINNAISDLSAAGGGVLRFRSQSYRCDAHLVGKSNVKLQLQPGTVLDFSNHATFQNGTVDSGFIRVDGTVGSAVSLAANAVPALPQTVNVTAHGLAVGNLVLIYDDTTRLDDDSSETTRPGEQAYVESVTDSDNFVLVGKLHQTYLSASGGSIKLVTPVVNFHFEGGKVKGKGANTGSGNGDRGFWLNYLDNFSIKGVEFEDIDYQCILMYNCINGEVGERCKARFDPAGEGDIQYFITFGMASHGIVIDDNFCYAGRHAVAQTNTNTAGYYGISRNITITDNTFIGGVLDSIATHQGVEGLTITGNTVMGCPVGVDNRFGKDTIINNNRFIACGEGVHVYRHAESIDISNNYMTVTAYGVRVDTLGTASSEVFTGGLSVFDNTIRGLPSSANGIFIDDTTSGRTANDIVVDGNRIVNMGDEAIKIRVGASDQTADGWTGSCKNNYVHSCGKDQAVNAILASNPKYVDFSHNTVIEGSGTLTSAVVVQGSGAIGCRAHSVIANGASSDAVRFTGGTKHESPWYQEQATGTITLDPFGVSEIDSTAGAVTATLGSGQYPGQMKTIVMIEASNSSTLSITNHSTSDPEVATFNALDESLTLQWTGTEWITAFSDGVTFV